ncbi:hypothetical protein F9L33_11165 [Amylibacter sp. SFDW26]|uniref:hypothetical protein n=1 Tax=Amylibacter sp. SFDW26 TaxID=2652722 RepID=UPI00126251D7|nr:hypothetical protein [Amylibacter sp. SFDW26]KAB7613911.1 hypothetical protein F9L33_11165 [Amylibacter sp. SFDW26]
MDYRWVLTIDSGYNVITVQKSDGFGCKLTATLPWSKSDDGSLDITHWWCRGVPWDSITPKFVAALINDAIDLGWMASKSGKPFRIDYRDKVFYVS